MASQFDARVKFGNQIKPNELQKYIKSSKQRDLLNSDDTILTLPSHRPHRRIKVIGGDGDGDEYVSTDLEDLKYWCSENKLKLPRYLFTTVCLAIAIYQSLQLSKEYVRYPTGVNVLVDELSSMRQTLPGITVCDSNKWVMIIMSMFYLNMLKIN